MSWRSPSSYRQIRQGNSTENRPRLTKCVSRKRSRGRPAGVCVCVCVCAAAVVIAGNERGEMMSSCHAYTPGGALCCIATAGVVTWTPAQVSKQSSISWRRSTGVWLALHVMAVMCETTRGYNAGPLGTQIAVHFREIYPGNNYTHVLAVKSTLTTKQSALNTQQLSQTQTK